jgi:hypothetical protein
MLFRHRVGSQDNLALCRQTQLEKPIFTPATPQASLSGDKVASVFIPRPYLRHFVVTVVIVLLVGA